jgi:hypothetical protein
VAGGVLHASCQEKPAGPCGSMGSMCQCLWVNALVVGWSGVYYCLEEIISADLLTTYNNATQLTAEPSRVNRQPASTFVFVFSPSQSSSLTPLSLETALARQQLPPGRPPPPPADPLPFC